MEAQDKAVVLVSGGMDSGLCLAIANDLNYRLAALHLNYGQRTQEREMEAFNNLCDHYYISERLVVDVSHFTQIGSSSLTDKSIEVSPADLGSEEIPSSYVPFRNGNILSIAGSWAETIGARAMFIGAVEADGSGYPDCRREFFDAYEKALNLGTRPDTFIRIMTPLIFMDKAQIVEHGQRLGLPFELTWSCYRSEDKACGTCDSCALRLRGFARAGHRDPLEYYERPDYNL